MFIQEDDASVQIKINRYLPGEIWINQKSYKHSVLLYPHLIQPFVPQLLSELTLQHCAPIFEDPPAIFLLGTGQDTLIPEHALLLPFYEKGIGIEFMNSKAACYTFTALAAEKRKVCACILIR